MRAKAGSRKGTRPIFASESTVQENVVLPKRHDGSVGLFKAKEVVTFCSPSSFDFTPSVMTPPWTTATRILKAITIQGLKSRVKTRRLRTLNSVSTARPGARKKRLAGCNRETDPRIYPSDAVFIQ